MNTKDFIRLGVPLGEATRRATDFISRFILAGGDKTRLEEEVKAIIANPSAFTEDSLRGELAKALLECSATATRRAGQIPPMGRRTGARSRDADGKGLPAAGGCGGGPDARCPRRLRSPDRRGAGH